MVRKLIVVTYKGKRWYLDRRLKQIRNIHNPHEWIDLTGDEVRKFARKGA